MNFQLKLFVEGESKEGTVDKAFFVVVWLDKPKCLTHFLVLELASYSQQADGTTEDILTH